MQNGELAVGQWNKKRQLLCVINSSYSLQQNDFKHYTVVMNMLKICMFLSNDDNKIFTCSPCCIKDLYSRKDTNLVFSPVARFYATTEQKLIHSFWNALRIRRKINQLHQSSCYTSSIYYTTQNNPWICQYRFNEKVFLIYSVSPLIHIKL